MLYYGGDREQLGFLWNYRDAGMPSLENTTIRFVFVPAVMLSTPQMFEVLVNFCWLRRIAHFPNADNIGILAKHMNQCAAE